MKIKKNDNVTVIAGKDRGKVGVVERVFVEANKIIVKGVAIAKKHVKPSRKNPQGGIIEINQKIAVSDVMITCPNCGKLTKVGYKFLEDKTKVRICKKCGQGIENGSK
ncbi:MAG: 50S ribosomal protein L24 [Candidatus Berkelbacteria bacterium]